MNSIVNDIFEKIDAEASCLARLCVLITQSRKPIGLFQGQLNKTNKEIDTNILVLLFNRSYFVFSMLLSAEGIE
jgi:hypothetical protein